MLLDLCIPPIDANPEDVFKIMKNLNDELNLKELSMGMSSDYLKATNSGSTFIRIGSKILEQGIKKFLFLYFYQLFLSKF